MIRWVRQGAISRPTKWAPWALGWLFTVMTYPRPYYRRPRRRLELPPVRAAAGLPALPGRVVLL